MKMNKGSWSVQESRSIARQLMAGALSITLAGQISWKWVCLGLGLLYLPMIFVTWKAPEPEEELISPKSLKEAIWGPFLGFLSKHRSIEILIFVVLYKFGDNLGQGLLRPFLIDMGYSATQRGVALGTIGLIATLFGTFVGGISTTLLGLGHCLWIFGFLQIFSNIGYIFLAQSDVNLPLFYGAMAFETFTQGLGTGAFSVLLIRMTQKRFSATQYALFSSLFGVARVLAGPLSGFMVDAMGWLNFFWATVVVGVPGLLLLHRFSPLGVKDPCIDLQTKESRSSCNNIGNCYQRSGWIFGGYCFDLFVHGIAQLHESSTHTRY
ncbi:MAG: MFS transporter [Bdellovibrionota bacterium]